MAITTRSTKGSELTHAEMDENFTDLRDGLALQVPKTKGTGLKIDSLGTPGFGWHDMIGQLHAHYGEVGSATTQTFIGNIPALNFAEGQEAHANFHIPHDYLMGSDLFIHVHWAHNSNIVTGGSCTWVFETTYSKGHNQAAFHASKNISIVAPASTTQYQHIVSETALSVSGGSSTQLNTDDIEVDGVIQCRLYLDSNDITTSGGTVNPFAFFVDVHYQSTGVPTKQKAPDFWT